MRNKIICLLCLAFVGLFISGCGGESTAPHKVIENQPSPEIIVNILKNKFRDNLDYKYRPLKEPPIEMNGRPITCTESSIKSGGPFHIVKIGEKPVDIWLAFWQSQNGNGVIFCKQKNGQWVELPFNEFPE